MVPEAVLYLVCAEKSQKCLRQSAENLMRSIWGGYFFPGSKAGKNLSFTSAGFKHIVFNRDPRLFSIYLVNPSAFFVLQFFGRNAHVKKT